ncbi:MAG: hypothetical protein HYV09_40625 [Deltaproteobacteria bacterium]|nr:hypothetical protein [Deltaproteobacteria bacterium]
MYELIRPSPHFQRFTDFTSPIDLLALVSTGKPCRWLRVEGGGTVNVKRASDNAAVPLNFGDKEVQDVACSEITSVSGTVTAVTVYW